MDEKEIEYDNSRTCGYLIKNTIVKSFLLDDLKLDDYTYNKLLDYIKKYNDHKHKKEKNLGIESIINYLKVYFSFINYYLDYIKKTNISFDVDYYSRIFGETERLNNKYKEEVDKLCNELKESVEYNKLSKQNVEKYKKLIESKDVELLSLDEQNQQLQLQINILKDIKLCSMEEKLNKTIDLLLELEPAIVENRAITRAVGKRIRKLIDRNDNIDLWIKEEKENK